MKCISCNKNITKGYTWEEETSCACSEKCLIKSGLSQAEINADINAGTIFWVESLSRSSASI